VTQEEREARSRENVPFELVLVRHGEPDWEKDSVDAGLSGLGRAQAGRAADGLRVRSVDAIYCSPLRRARETAEVVAAAQQLTPEIIGDLEEIRVPALRNMTQSEVDSYFAAAARHKLQERWDGFPGGETYREFHARVTSAAESILGRYGVHAHVSEAFTVWDAPARGKTLRIALVGHGGTNSVILSHLLGVAPVPWEWLRFETALAAVSIVALRPVSDDAYVWSLQRFGWREQACGCCARIRVLRSWGF
jgi:probable phosphoglycerate mutase